MISVYWCPSSSLDHICSIYGNFRCRELCFPENIICTYSSNLHTSVDHWTFHYLYDHPYYLKEIPWFSSIETWFHLLSIHTSFPSISSHHDLGTVLHPSLTIETTTANSSRTLKKSTHWHPTRHTYNMISVYDSI